ncbi:MAG: hypothetical protein WCR20_20915, partial [Verrucomicrobiota bacterium]
MSRQDGVNCYSGYTTPVTITVQSVVTAGTIGINQTICYGTTPSPLTSTASGIGSGTISYEWQTDASGSYVTIAGANSAGYSPSSLTLTTSYQRRTVSALNGVNCYSSYTTPVTITVTPTVTINAFSPATHTRCQGAGMVTNTTTANNATGITYTLDAATAAFTGNSINATTGAVTYAAGWSGKTTITATASGCNASPTTAFVETTTPTVTIAAFTPATSSRCQGVGIVTTTTTATNNSAAIVYSLDAASLAGGNTINSSTGAITYSAGWSGPTTLTASADGSNGPEKTTHVVTTTPTVTITAFSPAASTRCQGAGTVTTTTTASNNSAAIVYSLDGVTAAFTGNSINSSTGAVTYAAGWSGKTTITASAVGCNGPATTTLVVTTYASPTTSAINGKISPACSEIGVTYSVTLTSGSSYTWTVPSGANITAGATGPNNNQITVSFGSTNGDITVVETNANSCSGTTKKLSINLVGCGMNADFTGTPLTVCQGSTVTFTNTSTGTTGSTAYSWNFGTGATPATATTIGPHVVSYSTSGQKTVSLTITDGASKTETKTNYITVNSNVTISAFSPASSTRCQGGGIVTTTTTATNNSAAIVYSLDEASLAGGNTINSSTGEVTYSAGWSGKTTITASADGCNGPAKTTHEVTTKPTASPVVSIAITSGSNPTCSESPVTFTATPDNGGTTPSYQWKKGSIDVGSNSATYIDDGTTAGSITVVMTSTLGCVNSPTATSNA